MSYLLDSTAVVQGSVSVSGSDASKSTNAGYIATTEPDNSGAGAIVSKKTGVRADIDNFIASVRSRPSSAEAASDNAAAIKDRVLKDVKDMKKHFWFGLTRKEAAKHTCFRSEDFDTLDTNKDGKISKGEWTSAGLDKKLFFAIKPQLLNLSKKVWNKYIGKQASPEIIFTRTDTNGDGSISSDEARSSGFGDNFFKYVSGLLKNDDKVTREEWDKYF